VEYLFHLTGALGLALMLVAYFVRRRTERASPDARVLRQLQVAGSDLSLPHEIEFFFYSPSEPLARELEAALLSRDFQVAVSHHPNSKWSVIASKAMLPVSASLVQLREEFTELAASLQAEYDGCGTGVVHG